MLVCNICSLAQEHYIMLEIMENHVFFFRKRIEIIFGFSVMCL